MVVSAGSRDGSREDAKWLKRLRRVQKQPESRSLAEAGTSRRALSLVGGDDGLGDGYLSDRSSLRATRPTSVQTLERLLDLPE